ncbi:SGNH hydrolase superfamily [Sesbania bispinosa]|nr:SGNH hydrolase superfamily [Sesbania bispinosa]
MDTGNNNNIKTLARCNFFPYGKDFQGGIPTGRFSNGKVPSDIIVEELGIKEFLPAYLDPNLQPSELATGVCFASGGAGYDPLTSQVALAISLSSQLNLFKEYIEKLKGLVGEDRTNFILANSLYLVVLGSNDISNAYFFSHIRQNQYDFPTYADLIVNFASSFFKAKVVNLDDPKARDNKKRKAAEGSSTTFSNSQSLAFPQAIADPALVPDPQTDRALGPSEADGKKKKSKVVTWNLAAGPKADVGSSSGVPVLTKAIIFDDDFSPDHPAASVF